MFVHDATGALGRDRRDCRRKIRPAAVARAPLRVLGGEQPANRACFDILRPGIRGVVEIDLDPHASRTTVSSPIRHEAMNAWRGSSRHPRGYTVGRKVGESADVPVDVSFTLPWMLKAFDGISTRCSKLPSLFVVTSLVLNVECFTPFKPVISNP